MRLTYFQFSCFQECFPASPTAMSARTVLQLALALSCTAAFQLAPLPAELCSRGAAAAAPVELRSRGRAVGHSVLRLRGGGSWSSWFQGLLSKLGLFSKTGKLLVLGLDNAGKSTLLTLLVRNEVVPHAPTHQPVTDTITIGAMKMRAVDMGGHEIARRMWEMYSQDADGIVYIVDAMDRERFPEALARQTSALQPRVCSPATRIIATQVRRPKGVTNDACRQIASQS